MPKRQRKAITDNNMIDVTTKIGALHKVYEQVSGLPVQLTLNRIWAWEAWMAKGWTEADLRLVMAHLKRRSGSAPVWAKMHMMFTKFIADPQTFEELLSEAKAIARVPKFDPGKASVLRGTNRPDKPEPSKPKTAEQVIRESDALKALLEFRDSL